MIYLKGSDLQALHLRLWAELVLWAHDQGYKLTSGDAYRDARGHAEYGAGSGCAGYSASKSQHKLRLAHDSNLFDGAWEDDEENLRGGDYETGEGDWRRIGKYWESLHPTCRWGGRYSDFNHLEQIEGYDNREDTPL